MSVLDPTEQSTDQTLNLRPYSGALGVRVSGIRLAEVPAGSSLARSINEALWSSGLLVFPAQDLSPADLVSVSRLFGEPMVHPLVPHHPEHPEVIVIDSQQRKNRGRTDFWHADATFAPAPPKITLLQSKIIPPVGGDTMFANQVLALRHLSPTLRRVLAGMAADHSSDELATAVGRQQSEIKTVSHPVLRRHDQTGVPALYVNAGFTRRFTGLTDAESRPLLQYLFEVACAPEISCRHVWTAGDLLIWDNRVVQHYAVPDYGNSHRSMIRTVVSGGIPIPVTVKETEQL
jgi:taurine dioxygenase